MHLCMKIPRHTSKNPIAAGDFKWIFARNCEGTEQLQKIMLYLTTQIRADKSKKMYYNKKTHEEEKL